MKKIFLMLAVALSSLNSMAAKAPAADEADVVGTKFDLSWNGMEIPADAQKTYNFSGQWQSMKSNPADFDPANDKQIVIKFAEPLANSSWNFGFTKEGGEIQWNVTDADKTGWEVFEANVTEVMNGFFIQNTGSANSMTIAESYVVKNDESQVALSWNPDGWGPSIAVSGITSGNANITSQWAGVNMTAPEAFLQDGTKTLRIYANADMTGLPFQWCLTDIDGNASYPQLGVDETGLYAEFSTDLKIKSLYLQHTSTEAHAIDIKAITWTFKAAPVVADGDYIIKNVKSGLYIGGANSWGTQGSLVKHGQIFTLTEVAEGKYTFDSHTYNGAAKHFLGDNGYVDSDAFNFTIAKVDGGFTIASGEGKYVAPAADGKTIDCGAAEAAVWQIISVADAKAALAAATAEAPVDATFLIKAANFSRGQYFIDNKSEVWTIDEGCTNNNLNGGAYENFCAESYHSVFNIHQVLTEMPNGVYEFTAQGFYRQDGTDNENLPVFYVNEETQLFPAKTGTENSMNDASASFTKGDYTISSIFVKVEDGTIDLGVKNEANTNLWCIFDNFELAYYGAEADINDLKLAAYVSKLAELQAEAKTVEGKMGATEAADLAAALAVEPEKTAEAYTEAINELSGAISAAKNSIANYAKANVYAEIFAANAEAAGVDIEAEKAAYAAAYEAGTLEDFQPYKAIVDEAVAAVIEAAEAVEDVIVNADFEVNGVEGWTTAEGWANSNPWLHTSGSTNFGIKTNANFVEGWVAGPNKHGDERLTQNITLPAGTYMLTAEAQNLQQGDGNVIPGGFCLVAGEAKAVITNVAGTYAVQFEVAAEEEVTIGVIASECTGNWLCVDNFQLYSVKAGEPADEFIGTKFDLSWNGMEIPADALKTYNFSGQWQSMKADPADFDPANDKQIVIKFAEPLANNSWNFGYTKADGEIQWNVTDADKTGWTVFEADVTDIMNGFFIQNTGSSNSMAIAESYVVKNDESQVTLSWTPDGWGPSIAVSGITSGNANITSQWAGVNMTAPAEFLQDGTKTLRIYANADMTGLPFQWCLTDIDGNASYPAIGVDETGLYAEFSTDLKIKSLYLQHTSTEAHAIDIKAITWEFVAATAAEPVELASQKIDAKGGELVFSEGVELADGINIALNADAPLVGATVNLTVDDADATKVLVSYSVEDLPAGNYNFEIPEGVIVSSTTSGVYAGGKFEFTVEDEQAEIAGDRIAIPAGSANGNELTVTVLEENEEGETLSAKYTIVNGTWGDNASHLSIFKFAPLAADVIADYEKIVVVFDQVIPASNGDATYGFIPVGLVSPVNWTPMAGLDKWEYTFTADDKAKGIEDFSLFFNASGDLKDIEFTIKGMYLVKGEETAIEAVKAVSKDGKYLENGKIVIVKNGKKYNTVGARIK